MPTTPATEAIRASQDQMLDAVRQGQDAMVKAVGIWSETAAKLMPAAPAKPSAEDLPTPEELVETSFSFAERLLAAQHEFVKQVLAASAPVVEKAKPSNGSKKS